MVVVDVRMGTVEVPSEFEAQKTYHSVKQNVGEEGDGCPEDWRKEGVMVEVPYDEGGCAIGLGKEVVVLHNAAEEGIAKACLEEKTRTHSLQNFQRKNPK